jgi:hypothetical protein
VGQLVFGEIGDPLEVIMARIAEVGRSKAEENRHRTTVAALVLKKVGSVLGNDVNLRY